MTLLARLILNTYLLLFALVTSAAQAADPYNVIGDNLANFLRRLALPKGVRQ